MKKILATLLALSTLTALAETKWPDVNVNDVDNETVDSPVFQNEEGEDSLYVGGITLDQGSRKEWLRVSARYETRPEWIDALTLEFYVLLTDGSGTKNLFKGTVDYIDIPKNREHLAEMYMHFNTYARFYNRGSIKSAVIAKVDGKEVSIDRRNSLDDRWWEKYEAHTGRLLNRLDTPFRIVNVNHYEAQNRDPERHEKNASSNAP